MDNLQELIKKMKLPNSVAGVFSKVEVAEVLIKRHGAPKGIFMALCPTPMIAGCRLDVYEHHAKELISRWEANLDLRPGTDVEMMYALSGSSLVAPLTRSGTALYARLFKKVLPDVDLGIDAEVIAQFYDGEVEQLVEDLKRRTRNEERMIR